MWQRRMAAFLRGKGQILWDVTVDATYVHPAKFLAPGSRDLHDANNKAVDYITVLYVNSNSIGFRQRIWHQHLVGAEECSCWEC
jgi:hypothetical protein